MSDGQALLRTIAENPADDTARLVYADWLDENGQAEKAEFIRSQIALSVGNTPDKEATRKRVSALEQQHKVAWLKEALPGIPQKDFDEIEPALEFRRGFVSVLSVTPENYEIIERHRDAIFQAFPTIDAIHIEDVAGALAELTASKDIPQHIQEVRLNNYYERLDRGEGMIVGTSAARDAELSSTGEAVDDNIAATLRDMNALGTHPSFRTLQKLFTNNYAGETAESENAYLSTYSLPNIKNVAELHIASAGGTAFQGREVDFLHLKRLVIEDEGRRTNNISFDDEQLPQILTLPEILRFNGHPQSTYFIPAVLALENIHTLEVPASFFMHSRAGRDGFSTIEEENELWEAAHTHGFKHIRHLHLLPPVIDPHNILPVNRATPKLDKIFREVVEHLTSMQHLEKLETLTIDAPIGAEATQTLLDCKALKKCRFEFHVAKEPNKAEAALERKIKSHNAKLGVGGPGS